jgi:SAM-dependent methyltransferase
MSSDTQSHYSTFQPSKLGQRLRLVFDSAIFDLLKRYLKPGSTILEVGSGGGGFAELVTRDAYNYIGIEPSAGMRAALVDRGFEVIQDTVPPIKLPDESVDAVYSFDVVEHLETHSNVMQYYQESARVLKNNGILCTVAPNCDTIGPIFYLQDY